MPAPLDLGLLRTFLAVYRAGSLTAAAGLLGLTQPAVTGQLQTLEKRLGRPLFRRLPRGVAPTALADELARRVAAHLDALASVEPELTTDPLARTLRLGGPAEYTSTCVIPALTDLVRRGLRLRVTLGLADDLVADLAEGRLDLAVSSVRPRRRGVVATPLVDEEFVLVAAPRWRELLPAAEIAASSGAVLGGVPHLAYAEELPITRRYWRAVFGVAPPQTAAVTVPDLRAVLASAVAGAGVAVLPRYLCAAALAGGDLTPLFEPAEPPVNTLFLATRSDAQHLPHVVAVTQRLREAGAG